MRDDFPRTFDVLTLGGLFGSAPHRALLDLSVRLSHDHADQTNVAVLGQPTRVAGPSGHWDGAPTEGVASLSVRRAARDRDAAKRKAV